MKEKFPKTCPACQTPVVCEIETDDMRHGAWERLERQCSNCGVFVTILLELKIEITAAILPTRADIACQNGEPRP